MICTCVFISISILHYLKKKCLLAVVKFGKVGVKIHHSSCDIIPIHSSQVFWQSKHRGQSLLTEFSIVPSAKSMSDKVRGGIGVKSCRKTSLAFQQQFMNLTQFQLSLR